MKCLSRIVFVVLLASSASGQTTVSQKVGVGCFGARSKSPQASALLQQSLSAMGDLNMLRKVRDFVANGTITYNWGGKQVSGKAVIRGRGIDQFRLDASLPKGTRSWFVSHGAGELKEVDGTVSSIPYQNAISMSALIFPAMKIATALEDPGATVSDEGTVQVGGQQFFEVCVEPNLASSRLNQSASARYFIDPHSFEIVGVHDYTHPKENVFQNIPHAMYYSDFRVVDGIAVPFSVTETMYVNRVWSLQLDHIQFNAGLTDADFRF